MWNKDEVQGKVDQIKGKVKESVGEMNDDEQLREEGEALRRDVLELRRDGGAAIGEVFERMRFAMRDIARELETRFEPGGEDVREDVGALIEGLVARTWISLRGNGGVT